MIINHLHGTEEGAEEELGVGMTVDLVERHPAGRLLGHLGEAAVVQQVRQPHLGVADAVTERQVRRDVDARGRLRLLRG